MEEKNNNEREAKGYYSSFIVTFSFPPNPSADGNVNKSNSNSSSVSLQPQKNYKGYYTKKQKKEKKEVGDTSHHLMKLEQRLGYLARVGPNLQPS